jgi:hypothetical protein
MDTKIEVLLGQKHRHEFPKVRVTVNDQIQELIIDCDIWVIFDLDLAKDEHITLSIEYYDRTAKDGDPTGKSDTAILIKDIRLNGINDQKFIWEGIFRPIYPKDHPPAPSELYTINYLGFNGVWSLEMTMPLFTWIHQRQSLGWIYD